MLNADYAPFYEVKTLIFSKGKMTSGVKTEGTIFLLDDEDKTVYYEPLRNGWIEAKKDAEKGLTIEISNVEYKLVKE